MGGNSTPPPNPIYSQDPYSVGQANQLRQQNFQQAMIDRNRANAMREGRNLGQEFFGFGTMPRVREGRSQEESDLLATRRGVSNVAGMRSGEMGDIISRRQGRLGGFSAPEFGALRQKSREGFKSQQATSMDTLMRAQGGSRNPAAVAAQIARLEREGLATAGNIERDLFLEDVGYRDQALGAYEQSVTGAEGTEFGRFMSAQQAQEDLQQRISADELQREFYNNLQFQREKAGQLQSIFGTQAINAGDFATTARLALANQGMPGGGQGGGGKGGK